LFYKEAFSLWWNNTLQNNRLAPVTRLLVRKNKYNIKKKNAHVKSELKLKNSNTGRSKKCKKVIKIRKKHRRLSCPKPEIKVIAPQGPQGPQGTQGSEGPQGPQGIQGPPGPTGPIIIPQFSLTVERYFYIANSDIALPAIIPANQFTNDEGQPIAEFPVLDQNSFANLYINGMMQAGGSYSISSIALSINDVDETIFAGTPIILETVQLTVQIIP
jgi:hypothetical protein